MHQPNLDHAQHDRTLIAGHAAGDLSDPDRSHAAALLAACRSCSQLHDDLLAIAAATRHLLAPQTPARDFRLTEAQAARLRRGNWLRALLRPFGAAGSAVRPAAAALTSLGVAGLLVATVLPGLLGGAATSAPAEDATSGGAANAPAATAAPAFGPQLPGPQASGASSSPADYGLEALRSVAPESSTVVTAAADESSAPRAIALGGAEASGTPTGDKDAAQSRDLGSSPPNLLLIGSLAMLMVGLALFGLRFAGRRVR